MRANRSEESDPDEAEGSNYVQPVRECMNDTWISNLRRSSTDPHVGTRENFRVRSKGCVDYGFHPAFRAVKPSPFPAKRAKFFIRRGSFPIREEKDAMPWDIELRIQRWQRKPQRRPWLPRVTGTESRPNQNRGTRRGGVRFEQASAQTSTSRRGQGSQHGLIRASEARPPLFLLFFPFESPFPF